MKEERLLPVGTKVFDVRYGWGYIGDFHKRVDARPVKADFADNQFSIYYTIDGKYCVNDNAPALSLTEYNLETGGFTPISDFWGRPKVGDWGYFWDRESANVALFGRITGIETRGFKVENAGRWHNFSHDIPEHIKKQMEQK